MFWFIYVPMDAGVGTLNENYGMPRIHSYGELNDHKVNFQYYNYGCWIGIFK